MSTIDRTQVGNVCWPKTNILTSEQGH